MKLFRNLKSDWSLVPDPLCFWWLCPLKGTGFKRRNMVNFFKAVWISSFKISYFKKNFLDAIAVLVYLAKFKKGSGASFWCTFSAWFSHKNMPYLILYQWTKFQCHTLFLSQDIKQNVLLSIYLDCWWHHKL